MGIVSAPPFSTGLVNGYSDRIDISAQVGRPGGVESVFEFNGAYFNVRSWLDTFVITTIDGLADPDVRDSREVNPGRHGETYFNSFYGGRTLVLSGKLRAHTLAKMRNMQMGLKQIFGDLSQEYPLTIRSGNIDNDVMIYCKKSQPIVMAEIQQDFTYRRDFQITLRASNPYFFSVVEARSTASFDAGFIETFDTEAFVAYTNLVTNPSGHVDTTGYSAGMYNSVSDPGATITTLGSGTGVRATWASYPGYQDRNEYGPGVGDPSYLKFMYRDITVVPGTRYMIGVNATLSRSPRSSWINYWGFGVQSDTASLARLFVDGGLEGVSRRFVLAFTAPTGVTRVRLYSYVVFTTRTAQTGPYALDMKDLTIIDASTATLVDAFTGDSLYARWTGTRGTSTSEFLSVTGLEDNYSIVRNAGGVSNRAGFLLPNGSTGYSHLIRNNFAQMKSMASVIEYRTDATLTPTGLLTTTKLPDSVNYLAVGINIANTSSRLQVLTGRTDASSLTVLSESSVGFTVARNTKYWLRAVYNANSITAEHWTTDPGLGGSPTQTLRYTLAGTDATTYGSGVFGDTGLIVPLNSGLTLDNHSVVPAGSESSIVLTPVNKGNAPAPTIIRLTGPLTAAVNGGPAATLTLTDIALAEKELTVNAPAGTRTAIATDEYLVIDSTARTIKHYDASDTLVGSAFSQLDINSDWIELSPGRNIIEFSTYAAGAPDIEIRHRHTYI